VSTIEKSIQVDVPVRTAYDQWTQFETFPKFMDGVKQVQQLDDKHLRWKAEIAGVDREWEAEIVHQEPDERIAWRALAGAQNDGTVSFASVGADRARVNLRMEFDPEGLVEKVGDATNIVAMQVEKDLENFKEFIEAREAETGAWRGTVKPTGDVDPGPEQTTM
jgi:uncharacterized membrane protein